VTGAGLVAAAVARLRDAGIAEPARDARLLLAHALGIDPGRLTLMLPDPVTPETAERFDALVAARAERRPVSHLLGYRLFYGRRFEISPDVLDPRPESESLIEAALAGGHARSVLDLGTGSGCLLLTLLAEMPGAEGVGTDISGAALAVAGRNATALGLDGRARFRQADWCAGVEGQFDLIVSNPPYITEAELSQLAPEVRLWEPAGALSPGGDGLDSYRAILGQVARVAAPGARLLLEIGAAQGRAVADLCRGAGLENIRVHPDLDGRDRVVAAVFPLT
jgi:release factor glutamine methyltransferase